MFPGLGGDYGKFCNVIGTACSGEIYHVAGVRDYWLKPEGNSLSGRKYIQTSTLALYDVTGLLTGSTGQPEQAVCARVFLERSESLQNSACLPVTVTSPRYRIMSRQLVIGRRLLVDGVT